MPSPRVSARLVLRLRIVARIWSVLAIALFFMIAFGPDAIQGGPVPVQDWILLATFPGMAILGLLAAWKWEVAGGLIGIAGYVLSLLEYRVFRGSWFPWDRAFMLFLVSVVPAVLFVVHSRLAEETSNKAR